MVLHIPKGTPGGGRKVYSFLQADTACGPPFDPVRVLAFGRLGEMGRRGPVPKRTATRRRRNADSVETTTTQREGRALPPELPEDSHAVARAWYDSLAASGQSTYYEPSDWAAAVYVAEAITRNLAARRFSYQAFATIFSAMADLLTTEASRRRVRMEIERARDEEEESAGVAAIEDYRAMLGLE